MSPANMALHGDYVHETTSICMCRDWKILFWIYKYTPNYWI